MKKIISLLIIISILASCKVVDISGRHEVAYVKPMKRNSVVKLKGINKEFIFPKDTLKAGDFITIIKIKL